MIFITTALMAVVISEFPPTAYIFGNYAVRSNKFFAALLGNEFLQLIDAKTPAEREERMKSGILI